MFKNTYQRGFLSVFNSCGSKPLHLWIVCVRNGHTKRVTDEDLKSMAFEITGANVATAFIRTPRDPCISLGIKLPFIIFIVKNLKKFFSFEVQVSVNL
jgi:hypothetical protein